MKNNKLTVDVLCVEEMKTHFNLVIVKVARKPENAWAPLLHAFMILTRTLILAASHNYQLVSVQLRAERRFH